MHFGFCSALAVALVLGACKGGQPPSQSEGSVKAVREDLGSTEGFVIENSAVIPIHSEALRRDYSIYVKTPLATTSRRMQADAIPSST